MKGSMDRVQRGGPWTGSTGVVHGPGVHVLYTSTTLQVPACLLIRLKRFYKLKNIPKHLSKKTLLLILEEISVEFIPHIQKCI